MDFMISKIMDYCNGTYMKIVWKDKCELIGKIDTIYESCNCLSEDDPNYKEYYACAVEIIRIIYASDNFNKQIGELIEISIDNQPSKIELEDGTVIWDVDKWHNEV